MIRLTTNIKKLIVVPIILIMTGSIGPVFASDLNSTNYSIGISDLSSGGTSVTSNSYHQWFNEVGPLSTGASEENDKRIINGTHFSSQVADVSGLVTYNRLEVDLDAQVLANMTLKVEFAIKKDNGEIITIANAVDSGMSDGWSVTWNTIEDISGEDIVEILARGNDGLTWGPWVETSTNFIIDNLAPDLVTFTLTDPIFSPRNLSSVGVKDLSVFNFRFNETYPNNGLVKILKNVDESTEKTFVLGTANANLSVTRNWEGKDNTNSNSDEGYYTYEINYTDMAGNNTISTGSITLDDTSPTLDNLVLLASAGALNSQLGNLNGEWNSSDQFDSSLQYDLFLSKSEFNPKDIDGIQLWLDAADSRRIIKDSSVFKVWEDKSGKSHHAYQHNPDKAPSAVVVNSYPAVNFDGDDFLVISKYKFQTPSNIHISIFAVVESDEDAQQVLVSFDSNHFMDLFLSKGVSKKVQFKTYDANGVHTMESGSSILDGAPHLIEAIYTKTSTPNKQLIVDGVIEDSENIHAGGIGDNFTRFGFIGVNSIASSEDGDKVLSNFLQGNVHEILIFNKALTQEEIDDIEHYLDLKWGLRTDIAFTPKTDDQEATTWAGANVKDHSYYKVKVKSQDDAGNNTTKYSYYAQTPDRSAPDIETAFTSITTTEDYDLVYNPSAHKTDNNGFGPYLYWDTDMYITTENALKSAEEIVQAFTSVSDSNSNVDQWLSIVVSPDVNIDPAVDPVNDGNIYGKSQAWLKVTLYDEDGNFAQKDIQLHVTPVNDKPRFLADIGGSSIKRDSEEQIIYNVKFDEDTTGPSIEIDDYIIDVDNLYSDLVWTVSANNYINSISTDALNQFEVDLFTLKLKEELGRHSLEMFPTTNWYGDEKFDLVVSDLEGTSNSQAFTARVWPVNDAPIIKDGLLELEVTNEDTQIEMVFSDFEDDIFLEDETPTYSAQLKWSVIDYDTDFISVVSGNSSLADTIVLTPVSNKYGTTNIVVQLRDTDEVPELVFPPLSEYGGYSASPKTTTAAITLVWNPINDAPVISPVANVVKDEDAALWTIDLSDYESDVEDPGNKLSWIIQTTPTASLNGSFDEVSKVLTLTPQTNAWGTIDVKLSLSDSDDSISFTPYTENPITTVLEYIVTLNPVNDIPAIDHLVINGAHSSRTDMVMSDDEITISAVGYDDVGYSSDTRNTSVLGDEYVDNILNFGGTKNEKMYHYRWYIGNSVSDPDKSLEASVEGSFSPTDSFVIKADYYDGYDSLQGKTITIEVWPDDADDIGSTFTKTIYVNKVPSIVDYSGATPGQDIYTNDARVTVNWTTVTDDDSTDSDNIGYRLKTWKVPKWGPEPDDTGINASGAFYDSGWVKDLIEIDTDDMTKLFEHGTYYWTVWTGNQFSIENWDHQDSEWRKHFNVDLIDPVYVSFNEYIQLAEITANAVIFDSGNTRVLYGAKPVDEDDSWRYEIILDWANKTLDEFNEELITSGRFVIVDATASENWKYTITYPEGSTTYNVIIKDLAGNEGEDEELLYSFTIVGDNIPPVPFEINGSVLDTLSIVTSQNRYYLQGSKEKQSGIEFSGYNALTATTDAYQVVGFTPVDTFSFEVYPWKPIGTLTAIDRAGNRASQSTDISLSFYVGDPDITNIAQTQTIINSMANETLLQNAGLSASEITTITQSEVSITSNRKLISLELKDSDGNIISSLNTLEKGSTGTFTLNGNNSNLEHGVNSLYLVVQDEAYNTATQNYTLTVLKEAPNTNIMNTARFYNVSGSTAYLDLVGISIDKVTVNINSEDVSYFENGSNWFYNQADFDFSQNNVVITLVDEVHNRSSLTLWDKNYYGVYADSSDILLPITQIAGKQISSGIIISYTGLPSDVSGVYSAAIRENAPLIAMNLSSTQEKSIHRKTTLIPQLSVPESQNEAVHQVYVRGLENETMTQKDLASAEVIVGVPYKVDKNTDPKNLSVVRFNEDTEFYDVLDQEYTVDYANHRIITTINKTGIYALVEIKPFSEDLNSVAVYPNPWVPEDGDSNTGTLDSGLVFDNLSLDARVRLYTVSGSLVRDEHIQDSSWAWDGKNDSEKDVFSGVYLYIITDGQNKKTGKLTVIR
ncbi:hypothetical protein DID80_02135 [Candidatus Marinamargulisbacteria bacterium SCGC AAA071-K20]|nr:hypothetical protein DID80_02135 [Candidatus Marinamargulisbacteria bacterium SCGC AAA071-K20]